MTYNLDFLLLDAPLLEDKEHPRQQLARVFVKTCSPRAYPGCNELTFISHEAVSLSEFESEIDRLHAELEDLRRKARQKFAALAKRTTSN